MDPNICVTDRSASPSSTALASGLPDGAKDEESYMFEPPPLDWRSESSGDTASPDDPDEPGSLAPVTPSGGGPVKAFNSDPAVLSLNTDVRVVGNIAEPGSDGQGAMGSEVDEATEKAGEGLNSDGECPEGSSGIKSDTCEEGVDGIDRKSDDDDDHNSIHSLVNQLQLMEEEPHPPLHGQYQCSSSSQTDSSAPSLIVDDSTETTGLLFSESHHRDLQGMLQFTEIRTAPHPTCVPQRGEVDAVVSVSYSEEDAQTFWQRYGNGQRQQPRDESLASLPVYEDAESVWRKRDGEHPEEDDGAAESEQVS